MLNQSSPVCELPAGWDESIGRIARHCAKTNPSDINRYWLTEEARYDAALFSITQYIADHGWPESMKPLFQAGSNGVYNAVHETRKHVFYWAHWDGHHLGRDHLAEAITDRVAVRQLLRVLNPSERDAVEALAWTLDRGGYKAAAALLGISDAAMAQRLTYARKTARTLWCAPGEHMRAYRGSESKAAKHIYNQRAYTKR